MTTAIVVSPQDLHEYFTAVYQEWDTQIPVETLDAMWSGLQDGSLSTETNLVVFSDVYMEETPEDLAAAVASFAPEALVLVLFYQMENRAVLEGLVTTKARELGIDPAKYYSINAAGDIGQEIYDASVDYSNERSRREQQLSQAIADELAPTDGGQKESARPEPTPNLDTHAFNKNSRGMIVASTSSKGGSGKTTVALCTASMIYHASATAVKRGLRDKPLRVCVVDMDTRDGQIGYVLSQQVPTAINIFLAEERTPEVIARNLIYDEGLGIHALLAPKRARAADYLKPEFYQEIIQKLSTMFDVVILDTSVNYLDPLLGNVVLPISDAVMFVTNLSVGSVYGMNRWMSEVTSSKAQGGSGIPKEKIGVVVNQSAPNMGIDHELLMQASDGAPLLVAIPLDSASMISASNHNRLQDIILQHDDISPAYYTIAKQLLPNEALAAPLITDDEPKTAASPSFSAKPRKKGLRLR